MKSFKARFAWCVMLAGIVCVVIGGLALVWSEYLPIGLLSASDGIRSLLLAPESGYFRVVLADTDNNFEWAAVVTGIVLVALGYFIRPRD